MRQRILWQSVLPKDISDLTREANVIWDGLSRHAKMVARPDTEVVLGNLEKNLREFTTTFGAMVNSVFLVERIIQAEEEGFDAVVVGCNGDNGVKEARSAVDIPVVGLTESSVMMAKMYGFRSAVVTIRDSWVQPIESRAYSYGAREGLIDYKPVRYFEMNYEDLIDCFKGKSDRLIVKFEEVAQGCIKDGADVIINGCALTGPAFSLLKYTHVTNTGVPVIDCTAVAIKFGEIMVDLRRSLGMVKSKNRASIYRTPEKEKLEEFKGLFAKIS